MPVADEADVKPQIRVFLDGLLKCPNEIIVQILAGLDYKDLLAVRRTNHALHHLIHKHEKALSSRHYELFQWRGLFEDSSLFGHKDLSQIIELDIRSELSAKLAGVLADRIASKLHFRHTPFTEDELKAWKVKKAKRLAAMFEPAMFVLYDFFAKLRRSIWDVAERFRYLSDEDYLGLERVFDLDQQFMVEKVKPDYLIDVTESFRALQGVSSAKGLVLSRHGRILTGTTTVRSHIVYGGFHAFAETLCASSYSGGPIKYDKLVEDLWKPKRRNDDGMPPADLDERPLKTIRHLRSTQAIANASFSTMRSRDIQVQLIEKQSFLEKAAITVLQRKGILRRIDPDIPTIETWLRGVIAEKGDPWFEFGRWSRPDTFIA